MRPTQIAGLLASRATIKENSEHGFTMIELLVTMAVLVILLVIAVPQFKSAMQIQQVSSEMNNFLNDLQFARGEALKEGANVSLCASTDSATCSTTSSWDKGWIIYTTPTAPDSATFTAGTSTILRVQTGFTTGDSLTSTKTSSVLTFNQQGFPSGVDTTNGLLFTLTNNPVNQAATRCLLLDSLGRRTVQQSGTGSCP